MARVRDDVSRGMRRSHNIEATDDWMATVNARYAIAPNPRQYNAVVFVYKGYDVDAALQQVDNIKEYRKQWHEVKLKGGGRIRLHIVYPNESKAEIPMCHPATQYTDIIIVDDCLTNYGFMYMMTRLRGVAGLRSKMWMMDRG